MSRGVMLLGAFLLLQLPVSGAAKKYWVMFRDKGPGLPSEGPLSARTPAYEAAAAQLSPRALARRAKVLPAGALLDARDLPLYPPYVELLGQVVHESRWLNAASVYLTEAESAAVSRLPAVRE